MIKGGVRAGLLAALVLVLAALPSTSGAGTSGGGAPPTGGTGMQGTPTSKPKSNQCLVPGFHEPLQKLWKPDVRWARHYAKHRAGDIEFAVRIQHGGYWGYRANHQEWSASVVKAMLLVAYLDQPSVANRALDSNDTSLLYPMIVYSDNNAAQQVFNEVGQSGLQALADRVHMTHFATSSVWGETEITASDQTKYLLHIDHYIAPRHKWYAMRLLRSITPSQRWGIGEIPLHGWKLFFKGGWGYGTGLMDHQVVLLWRGCARVSLAVLTMHDGNPCCSHDYGKQTLYGMFRRLLKGFPTTDRKP